MGDDLAYRVVMCNIVHHASTYAVRDDAHGGVLAHRGGTWEEGRYYYYYLRKTLTRAGIGINTE